MKLVKIEADWDCPFTGNDDTCNYIYVNEDDISYFEVYYHEKHGWYPIMHLKSKDEPIVIPVDFCNVKYLEYDEHGSPIDPLTTWLKNTFGTWAV